ncbi:hypothetical protein C8R43DRAFT_965694 [Mycena crocata]|nr:hypothetical protein C8R43DRAFT_965694 [Mycena crocata]
MDAGRRKEQDITGSEESVPQASPRSTAARKLVNSLAAAFHSADDAITSSRGPWMQRGERNRISPGVTNQCHKHPRGRRKEQDITGSEESVPQASPRSTAARKLFTRTMDAVRRKEQDITGSEESVPQASQRSDAARKLARSLAAAFHSAEDAITSSSGPWMQGGERNRISPGFTRTMDAARRKEQDITGSEESVPQASQRSDAARKLARSLAAAFHSDEEAITISRGPWMQRGERNRISPGVTNQCHRHPHVHADHGCREEKGTGYHRSEESVPQASPRSTAARKLVNSLAAAFHSAEDAITISRGPWMQGGERNRISPGRQRFTAMAMQSPFHAEHGAARRKEQDITGSEESVPQASQRSDAGKKLARSLAAAFHSDGDAITISRRAWSSEEKGTGYHREKLANSLAAAFHSDEEAITSSRGPWSIHAEHGAVRRKEQDITGSEQSVPQASPRSNAARKLANSLAAAFHSAEDALTSSRGAWSSEEKGTGYHRE